MLGEERQNAILSNHRSLRARNALMSQLDQIEGVGPKRKRALFEHFLTLDAIRQADVDTLCKAPGMNRPTAERVYAYFRMEKQGSP